MRFFTICFLLALFVPKALFAKGDVYALVIGIDKYTNISELHGAVNDANDMASSFRYIGAKQVIKLTDAQATRQGIIDQWQELTQKAGEGDYLFFYYAGHGSKHEAINPDYEEDGFDELFLLTGYASSGEGTKERLLDDEMAFLFAQEKEAEVILVADSCYSGSMERGRDLRANQEIRRNNQFAIDPSEDRLRSYLEKLSSRPEAPHPRLTKIFASSERTVVPEIALDQQVRGAFSYHLARALRGRGDLNNDGLLGLDEIRQTVFPLVQKATEGKQSPEVSRDNELASQITIPLRSGDSESHQQDETLLLGVAFVGEPLQHFKLPKGFVLVENSNQANLIIDFNKKHLITTAQDVAADFSREPSFNNQQLIGALNKWRLIAKLDQIRADGEPQLSLVGGNGLYTEAETVVFDIRSPVYSNIILFNLAYDGTIQHLAPSIPDDPGLAGGHIIPQHSIPVPSIVVPPFGADHLFAIVSPAPLIGLAGRINDLDGTAKTDLLFNEWDTYTKGNRYAVSRIGLYTRGKQ